MRSKLDRNVFQKHFLVVVLMLPLYMMPVGATTDKIPFAVESVELLRELSASFQKDAIWRGADGACSISLDQNTSVWLFGDTFVRRSGPQTKKSDEFAFLNNTAAVMDLPSQQFKFYWKSNSKGAQALLAPEPKSGWYWPGDGLVLDDKLYVVNKLVIPNAAKSGMFGFDWISDDLTQIANPKDPPSQWHCHTVALPEHKKKVLLGTACYLDDFAYFYTSLLKDAHGMDVHPAGIARIDRSSLKRMQLNKVQFWNGHTWTNQPLQSAVIFPDGAPEMTITRLIGEPYLVATYMPPLSADICMRFAKKPEGPWSSPLKVYRCSEASITILNHKDAVYSAKAHPELSQASDVVTVSYCSNPGEMKHYLSRPDLYFPRMISVKLKRVQTE